MRAIEVGLFNRIAGEWPRSCHPILVADRGLGAIELFHALDVWGWEGIVRGKGVDTRGSEPQDVAAAGGLGRQKARLAGLGPGSLGSIVW